MEPATSEDEALASAHIPYEGQAGIHLIRTAGLMGLVCYGPERDGSETFVLAGQRGREAGIARQEARVNLLPAFDPYLLGYKDRSLAIEAAYIKNVNAGSSRCRSNR